jgi:LuxR family maltose regulon positive regulatory protein
MNIPINSTKLHIPNPRQKMVRRPRLIEHLNNGLLRKLTLVSASAGYGKTSLVSGWLVECKQPVVWLSLDEGDNDVPRFLTHFFAAIRTIDSNIGVDVNDFFLVPEPPIELILSALLDELHGISFPFVLVLDDYHMIELASIHKAICTLVERKPPKMHIVIATREDPPFPLAQLRVQNQLTEVRVGDLQFTTSEAAEFLSEVMGIKLAPQEVELLETRTEGWIAGLQLAALTIQGRPNPRDYIQSFTGNHPFVLDYLLEEVLKRQPANVQKFLLHTSILDRMCGLLCDALFTEQADTWPQGQEVLEYLERANLFIVPLDHERRWYRYHHLFTDLLRRRLQRQWSSLSTGDISAVLHKRASIWLEENGYEIEAFQHAVSAHDIERAAYLIEGKGLPLLFRGAVAPVCKWLASQTQKELDSRPQLWVLYASALMMSGRMSEVESKLSAAENALQDVTQDDQIRDLIGHIAATRASIAVSKHQTATIIEEARRALLFLHSDNLPVRTAANWALGYAYQLQGDRVSASKAYAEGLSISQRIGHVIIAIMSSLGLGNIQECDNLLHTAADTYRRVLELAGNPPFPVACEAYLGLARIHYQWNDLEAALQYGQQAIRLAEQIEQTDRIAAGNVVLARLKLVCGDVSGAACLIADAEHAVRRHQFIHLAPDIIEAQVDILLHQGNLAEATQMVLNHDFPIIHARIHLAEGDPKAALAVLELVRRNAEEKDHQDVRIKAIVLQALAFHAQKDMHNGLLMLEDALVAAERGGLIRIFLDEGEPMADLLREASNRGRKSGHLDKVLKAYQSWGEHGGAGDKNHVLSVDPLIESLSKREVEVLRLIADGKSNKEISDRLYLALSTVKGYNRNIFDKLQVNRRTEAVARARSLGLLN